MSNNRKKVIVRRFSGDAIPGYLDAVGIVRQSSVELLDMAGRILTLPLEDIKTICYVRDFNLTDAVNPERLLRRTFLARPRGEGLWVRMTFRSGDQFEGLASTDRSLLDAIADDAGLYLTPPDTRANTQRVYIPRTAITDLTLLAVITSPSRRKTATQKAARESPQDSMFHLPFDPDSRPN